MIYIYDLLCEMFSLTFCPTNLQKKMLCRLAVANKKDWESLC